MLAPRINNEEKRVSNNVTFCLERVTSLGAKARPKKLVSQAHPHHFLAAGPFLGCGN